MGTHHIQRSHLSLAGPPQVDGSDRNVFGGVPGVDVIRQNIELPRHAIARQRLQKSDENLAGIPGLSEERIQHHDHGGEDRDQSGQAASLSSR